MSQPSPARAGAAVILAREGKAARQVWPSTAAAVSDVGRHNGSDRSGYGGRRRADRGGQHVARRSREQEPTRPVSVYTIMRSRCFAIGASDARAGRPPRPDYERWDPGRQWDYERGRARTEIRAGELLAKMKIDGERDAGKGGDRKSRYRASRLRMIARLTLWDTIGASLGPPENL
jgi:hypothetical protein